MIALTLALLLSSTPIPSSRAETPQPVSLVQSVAREDAASANSTAISVRLRCTAYGDGHVGACSVLEESRPGLGFGRAAVALMEMSGTEPDRHDDHPVDVTFEHTIEFTR